MTAAPLTSAEARSRWPTRTGDRGPLGRLMRTAAVNRGSGANADTAHVVATGCAVTTAPVTYQWLRNGRTIRGAALPTFRVRRRDRGDLVSLRVTALATAIGPSAQRTSAPVRVRR